MPSHFLEDRGVVRAGGPDALGFLNNLITCDLAGLAPGSARFGALLSPQGKLLFDFLVTLSPAEEGGAFYLDCPAALAPELAKKLSFYKLRARVEIEDQSRALGVAAVWGAKSPSLAALNKLGLAYADPRAAALGYRIICERIPAGNLEGFPPAAPSRAYTALRISQGVPQGGIDFIYGDVFPHDVNMDLLGGIDFKKGCYAGQEIVSRMQHRGTARTRIVRAAFTEGFGCEPGAEVKIGERLIGRAGSSLGSEGLLMLRIDRVLDAPGAQVQAGGIPVTVSIPAAMAASLKSRHADGAA